jgi:hypothetical protein
MGSQNSVQNEWEADYNCMGKLREGAKTEQPKVP